VEKGVGQRKGDGSGQGGRAKKVAARLFIGHGKVKHILCSLRQMKAIKFFEQLPPFSDSG
jgi:hypothetical protein